MTQIAIFNKDKLPNIKKIESDIQKLGYDFKFSESTTNLFSNDGLECSIDGYETYIETYIEKPKNIISEFSFIEPDIEDEDAVLSFVWGADFAAGASIGLISIALIDNCKAKIYYLDDEMKYSREMLVADTPQFLRELKKQPKQSLEIKLDKNDTKKKTGFWNKLKNKFK